MHDMSSKGNALVDSQSVILTSEALYAEDFSLEQQSEIVQAILKELSHIRAGDLFVIDYYCVMSITDAVEASDIFNDCELTNFKDNALEICQSLAWNLFNLGCKTGVYHLEELNDDLIRIDYRETTPCLRM